MVHHYNREDCNDVRSLADRYSTFLFYKNKYYYFLFWSKVYPNFVTKFKNVSIWLAKVVQALFQKLDVLKKYINCGWICKHPINRAKLLIVTFFKVHFNEGACLHCWFFFFILFIYFFFFSFAVYCLGKSLEVFSIALVWLNIFFAFYFLLSTF